MLISETQWKAFRFGDRRRQLVRGHALLRPAQWSFTAILRRVGPLQHHPCSGFKPSGTARWGLRRGFVGDGKLMDKRPANASMWVSEVNQPVQRCLITAGRGAGSAATKCLGRPELKGTDSGASYQGERRVCKSGDRGGNRPLAGAIPRKKLHRFPSAKGSVTCIRLGKPHASRPTVAQTQRLSTSMHPKSPRSQKSLF